MADASRDGRWEDTEIEPEDDKTKDAPVKPDKEATTTTLPDDDVEIVYGLPRKKR